MRELVAVFALGLASGCSLGTSATPSRGTCSSYVLPTLDLLATPVLAYGAGGATLAGLFSGEGALVAGGVALGIGTVVTLSSSITGYRRIRRCRGALRQPTGAPE